MEFIAIKSFFDNITHFDINQTKFKKGLITILIENILETGRSLIRHNSG